MESSKNKMLKTYFER